MAQKRLSSDLKFQNISESITSPLAHDYHHLYKARLSALRFPLEKKAALKWPNLEIKGLSSLNSSESECVIIGVLYKRMERKINPLDFFNGKTTQKNEPSFVSRNDKLFLEDFEGRIEIENLDAQKWTTGFFVAVKGNQTSSSRFFVNDFLLPGLPIQRFNIRGKSLTKNGDRKHVAIISGLNFSKNLGFCKILGDFLTGNIEDKKLKNVSAKISHLVIAGGSFSDLFPKYEIDPIFDDETKNIENESTTQVKSLDSYLSYLSTSIPIFLMPSKTDPTNLLLPQQPINPSLLPVSHSFSHFKCVPNPALFSLNGMTLLGTSGENIEDIKKYSEMSQIEAMKKSICNRLICPTAPDTLPCKAFGHRDELILEQCPNLYFCGNAKNFERDKLSENDKEIVLMAIPSFYKTGTVVLVDSQNLESEVVTFEK
ncbi:hypothetical protein MHBO_001436 [Bonamia ostreae]|uniref:DNA polymerase delta small subunit n=1 Tax=Bonamia ostreae TaxID=126728 RepID=A0ABV2AIY8_9EUKA